MWTCLVSSVGWPVAAEAGRVWRGGCARSPGEAWLGLGLGLANPTLTLTLALTLTLTLTLILTRTLTLTLTLTEPRRWGCKPGGTWLAWARRACSSNSRSDSGALLAASAARLTALTAAGARFPAARAPDHATRRAAGTALVAGTALAAGATLAAGTALAEAGTVAATVQAVAAALTELEPLSSSTSFASRNGRFTLVRPPALPPTRRELAPAGMRVGRTQRHSTTSFLRYPSHAARSRAPCRVGGLL
jgi:hypothetical protein